MIGFGLKSATNLIVRRCVLAIMLALGVSSDAFAQAYPTKPITIIVPLTAGSPVDVAARLAAQHLSAALGQPVIVENRAGAGGTIGTKYVAGAEPDGYVLMLNAVNQVIAPAMYKNLTYDPIKDFTSIGAVAQSPFVFVVPPTLPVQTLAEFIAYAKANPGKLNFGYGLGTSPHILGELFKSAAGVDLANIPYKGGAQAINDMLAGQIHLNIGTPATLVQLIATGKLKALAVTGDARYPDLRDVPTIIESGFPQLSLTLWMGMMGPAGMPPDVSKRLNTALNELLQSKQVRDSLARQGFVPTPGSPEAFEAFLYKEMDAWGRAVKLTGVKVN
jgi:tripartite-type tricarboxylate transporter receptor subunit TctC